MRASSMTLASKCRGSVKILTGFGSVPSRLGTAFHELAKAKVLDGQASKEEFERVKLKYGLSEEELTDLRISVYNLDIQIPEGVKIHCEEKLESKELNLSGSPDLWIPANEIVTVVDWKSGWGDVEDPDTNHQMLSYCVLILEKNPEIKTFKLIIVQPRLNKVRSVEFSRDQILKARSTLKTIIKEAKSKKAEYTTGPWCQSCFACMNCPAFAGEVMKLYSLMVPENKETLPLDKIRQFLPFAKAMTPIIKKIEDLAKAHVYANGDLALGDGTVYSKVLEYQDNLDSAKVAQFLWDAGYEFDEIIKAVKITKTNLKEAIKAHETALGNKKTLTKVFEEVRASGAIGKKEITKFKILKSVK